MIYSESIQSMLHKHGLRLIRGVPNVVSAIHITRKKRRSDGSLTHDEEHLIRVRIKTVDGIKDREVILHNHPNSVGIETYQQIANLLKNNEKN